MLLSTKRSHEKKIMNLFRRLKLELQIFEQYFTPPTKAVKKGETKTTLGPKHTDCNHMHNNTLQ
jgi:hypothetical protein